jgi:predicted pyridoxine 5'-phosphate oxidase superfamily flavin-nucleotide-binding protein
MASIPDEAMELIRATEPDVFKAIATVDEHGIPNVAPMGSITALDPETMAFIDGMSVHTRANLDGKNNRVSFTICKRSADRMPTAYQVKGTFAGFQTSGPIYDNFVEMAAARGIKFPMRAVGLVKVDEVYAQTPMANSRRLDQTP